MGSNDPSFLRQVRSHTAAIEETVAAAHAQGLIEGRNRGYDEGFKDGAEAVLAELRRRDADLVEQLLANRQPQLIPEKPETAVHQPTYSGPMSETKFDSGLTILPEGEDVCQPPIEDVRQAAAERKRTFSNQLPMSTPLEELGLSAWTIKVLHNGRIYTVGHLLDTSSRKLTRIGCVTRAILEEIDGRLSQYYLERPRDAEFEARIWNYRPNL